VIWQLIASLLLCCVLFGGGARAETFDYLIACPDQPTCQNDPIIGKYWHAGDSDNPQGSWDGSRVIPNVQVYQVTGTSQQTDPQTGATYTVENRCYYAGGTPGCPEWTPLWDLVIALTTIDPALEGSPYTVPVSDRELAASGAPQSQFIVFASPAAQPLLGVAIVSPTFAGSNYPFSGANQ
jgi:hypothetical protein